MLLAIDQFIDSCLYAGIIYANFDCVALRCLIGKPSAFHVLTFARNERIPTNHPPHTIIDYHQRGSSFITSCVLSGVPQGFLLEPFFILFVIDYLSYSVSSQMRPFSDDCVLHWRISAHTD